MFGLTQKQVGEHLNISFQQFQQYENGTDRLVASRLYRLSVLLKVPVDYFFEDLQEPPASEADAQERDAVLNSDMALTRAGVKLLRAFSRIKDSKTRKYIADLVDELAGGTV